MIVLGLDISTANIGLCVLDDGTLIHAEGLPMSKTKGLFAKAECFRQTLDELHQTLLSAEVEIDAIVVEQSLQAFRRRMSSASTIATLNRFNGIVSYIARRRFSVPLYQVNAVSARKQIGLTINKKSEKTTKDQILCWVKQQPPMNTFDWPTKILKGGPDKGSVRDEVYCYDIADAFVVARWGIQHLKKDMLDDNNV